MILHDFFTLNRCIVAIPEHGSWVLISSCFKPGLFFFYWKLRMIKIFTLLCSPSGSVPLVESLLKGCVPGDALLSRAVRHKLPAVCTGNASPAGSVSLGCIRIDRREALDTRRAATEAQVWRLDSFRRKLR